MHEMRSIAVSDTVCLTDQGPARGGMSWGPKEHCTLDGSLGPPTDSMRPSPNYFDHLFQTCALDREALAIARLLSA